MSLGLGVSLLSDIADVVRATTVGVGMLNDLCDGPQFLIFNVNANVVVDSVFDHPQRVGTNVGDAVANYGSGFGVFVVDHRLSRHEVLREPLSRLVVNVPLL